MFIRSIGAFCAALGLLAASPANAQQPLKIGFIASFSGPIATLGQDQYDGFMLALAQRGGKLGGIPIEVFKQDDQFKPEVALALAQKLIDRDHVEIITGITGSNVITALSKPLADRKVFLLSTNSGPSNLAGAGCQPYQFVVSYEVGSLAEGVGRYASDKGYRKMILLAPNYVGGKDLIAGFKRFYTGTVQDEIYTSLNQLDFSSELTRIAAAKPDAVFVFYPAALGVNFVRQYQQAGPLKTLPLLSTGTIDGTTLPALKDTAIGALSGHFWGPDVDNAANHQFVEAFEKKYDRIPSNLAAQAYDGALLLDAALAKVKGDLSDKPAFAAALKAADFNSVRGTFRFGNNNFPIQDMRMFEVARDAKGRVNLKVVATSLKDYQDPYHTQCPLH